jgi:hypothetical protein
LSRVEKSDQPQDLGVVPSIHSVLIQKKEWQKGEKEKIPIQRCVGIVYFQYNN